MVLTFLGILLDTVAMQMRLPPEKLEELRVLILKWETYRCCRKRQLLSLIGKLAHAAKVVKPRRIFLRHIMIDTATKAKRLDLWIHLRKEFHSDLAWLKTFLEVWNDVCLITQHMWDPKFSQQMRQARGCVGRRGESSSYNFSGLEHGPMRI